MNPKPTFGLFPLRLLIVTLLTLCAISFTVPARAQSGQGWPTSTTTLALSGTTVGTNTTTAITSSTFSPNQASGFAVIPTFVMSGTATTNVTFNFQLSPDGVNWTTGTPVTAVVAANGTSTVTGFVNFPPNLSGSAPGNVGYARLASVTNANTASTLTIGSIIISVSNR